jgi:enediyne polyketide synthase
VKAIDVDPFADAMPIAEAIVREIEDGGDRVDVAYSDRRLVVNLRRLPASGPVDDLPFEPGETVLFSGGGRGVVYVCARSLAERGVAAVVCGRTPLPAPNAPGLELDDDEFAAFRFQELQRRAREEGITPSNFNREFERVARQRELRRNLQEAARRGLPLRYEVCDITRLEAVNGLAQGIRGARGRITGIVHGAMVEHSARLPNKQRSVIEATVRTKVAGLINLLESTREDDLRAIVCFGSGAGRFGNPGQTDYSGANALMAAALLADARQDPRNSSA